MYLQGNEGVILRQQGTLNLLNALSFLAFIQNNIIILCNIEYIKRENKMHQSLLCINVS